jgi:hypothetical protein
MCAVYYVIPYYANITECGEGTTGPEPKVYHSAEAAKNEADKLHARYGNHWRVIKEETIWTTKTLAEFRAEGAF